MALRWEGQKWHREKTSGPWGKKSSVGPSLQVRLGGISNFLLLGRRGSIFQKEKVRATSVNNYLEISHMWVILQITKYFRPRISFDPVKIGVVIPI